MQENVADGTEIVVNNVITGKVVDSLMNLSQLIGNQVLKAADTIKNTIPSELQGAIPKFVQTSTGEIIAVAESTGEDIGAAVAAKKVADNIKNAAQAKNSWGGGNKGPEDNKQKNEPKEGSPEWNELHPHGKYNDAGYHKPDNSSKPQNQSKQDNAPRKSPAPQDGQKALDNSYGMKDYEHRAAIEDGKYVVLYKTANETFHGFICDDWSDVPLKIQAIFKEHKLVHPKSGEILKNLRN